MKRRAYLFYSVILASQVVCVSSEEIERLKNDKSSHPNIDFYECSEITNRRIKCSDLQFYNQVINKKEELLDEFLRGITG